MAKTPTLAMSTLRWWLVLTTAWVAMVSCTMSSRDELGATLGGVEGFCAIHLTENLPSAWCKVTCATKDNTLVGFNLNPFRELTEFRKFEGNDDSEYKWDPCLPLSAEGEDGCTGSESPAMCWKPQSNPDWVPTASFPPVETVLHTETKDDGLAFSLLYKDAGNQQQTTMDFYCASGETPGTISDESEKATPQVKRHFVVRSSYACATAVTPTKEREEHHVVLSPGTIVLISLAGIVVLYLAGGMAYKGVAKDARGTEAIPNIDLWAKLFSWVKIGGLWLMSPCYKHQHDDTLAYQML